jgi:RNA polymerase sigma factor (sigma-70 family)
MNATVARLTRLATDVARESDGRLLDSFLTGNQPAFRELVARHSALVFAVCNRVLRHRQDSEDAFQAVFLVLARRAGDVWPRDAVGAWLYGVAHRVALKARALRTRKQGREQPLEDMAQVGEQVPELDTAEIVDGAVRKLPEPYRAAVVACDLEGLSRAEAAVQLGWKEGTLSGRLARARKLLAERLRRVGLTFPVGGVAAVLGTSTSVRAGLTDSIIEVVLGRAAGGVPPPVAALTEGVVQNMFLFKMKTAVAMLMVAGAVAFGAWAAAGAGDSPGAGASKQPAQPLPATGKTDAPRKAEQQAIPPVKIEPVLELLQGTWRVESITSEGKEIEFREKSKIPDIAGYPDIEISGNSLFLPYRDASTGWKTEQHTIAVGDKENPRTIDLISSGKPVGRGIYEFTAPVATCVSCHTTEGLFKPPVPNAIGLCGPGLKKHTGLRIALATNGARPKTFGEKADGVVEFNLVRVDKAKLSGAALADELAPLQGEWIIGQRPSGQGAVTPEQAKKLLAEARADHRLITIKGDAMDWPQVLITSGSISSTGGSSSSSGGTTSSSGSSTGSSGRTFTSASPRKYKITLLDWRIDDGRIDLTDSDGRVTRGIYRFEDGYLLLCLSEHEGRPVSFEQRVFRNEPMWTLWQPIPTPAAKHADEAARRAALQAAPPPEVAAARLALSRAELDRAKATLAMAEAQLDRANLQLDAARWAVEVAKKAAALADEKARLGLPGNPPATPAASGTFTVHVRPLAAAEKVISVKATGKETVLEGLVYAAEEMAIKADSLTVWVVRNKEILPVDLVAITQKGIAATNYTLKSGDQLFVQVKIGK